MLRALPTIFPGFQENLTKMETCPLKPKFEIKANNDFSFPND